MFVARHGTDFWALIAKHGTEFCCGTARLGTARHGTARHGTARNQGLARNNTEWKGTTSQACMGMPLHGCPWAVGEKKTCDTPQDRALISVPFRALKKTVPVCSNVPLVF
jgi:hypothetical protein